MTRWRGIARDRAGSRNKPARARGRRSRRSPGRACPPSGWIAIGCPPAPLTFWTTVSIDRTRRDFPDVAGVLEMVRSLENLPEQPTLMIACRRPGVGLADTVRRPAPGSWRRTPGRPGACSGRRGSAACRAIGAKMPGSPRLKWSGADQVQGVARLRLVLVVPAGVVPAAAVLAPARRSGRRGRSSPRRPPRPSRWSRRRGCRRSGRRSS